ncbi:protein NRT1/ PTR FAMILY 2.13-like [Elaeis guineensis]|uniref:Protein NRT1/ PTR FAMILY 2.13-like n=1 Tax=Elaeis guineensis var. tenera TaxID=51953 RepID=A0A6I9RH21_ELAGV|nr:protein NRT1/ PTR FAMILY 2.13-like [Elaeis guineensis]
MMTRKCWLRLFTYMKCAPFTSPSSEPMDVEGASREVEGARKPRGWQCMPYVIGNEAFEKVASIGLTANLTVYLVNHFNMEQVEAANLTNIFYGTTNFAPLIGAFISDAYWGRFRTLAYGSFASLLGMLALTLSASIPQLQTQSCSQLAHQVEQCMKPSKAKLSILFISLSFLVLGAGGIRPCSLPFGVDQFDYTSEEGLRGLNSYFNWYYGTTTAAFLISLTVVVYIQNSISWSIGFAIPTALMLLSVTLFFLGTRLYVYVPPEGSIFSGIAQVFVASFKKRKLELPCPDDAQQQESVLHNPPTRSARILKLPLSLQFRFLNKAAIKCDGEIKPDGTINSWRLCSVQQIEEVKCLMRIVPIWFSGIICFVAMAQQWTFLVLQAMQMDRHLGSHFQIPPGSVGTISLLALALFLPIYDKVFVPMARRITRIETGITLLQRQGVGLVFSTLSMVVAALVEHKRRDSALSHGRATPMSVLWLAPQLILTGIAEGFNAVGQVEFYNRQFPEHMQTLAGSLFFCSLAGANYLSSFLVSVVKKTTGGSGRASWLDNNINIGRVDYYYYVITIMGVVNLLYFLVCAHYYRYKGLPLAKE